MQKELNKLHGLDQIVEFMQNLLSGITIDLEKSTKGNKAASQRVRTGTVKLEKVAKMYRKESILTEKGQSKSKSKRKTAAPKSKVAAKIAPKGKAPAKVPAKAAAKAPVKKAAAPAPAKAAVKTQKAAVKPKALAVKRPTAKLPSRGR